MKYIKIILLIILLVTISVIGCFFMLLSDNRTPEYKNLSYEQRREFNKRIVVSKEDLYSNQLLYGKIIDFIIKNKIITISSDREPYKIEALVDNWFKEVNCVDQCLLGNNRNIFEVMKQLGITRIVNVKNYPLKELGDNYIDFIKDQDIFVRGGQERGYRFYDNILRKDKFIDKSFMVEPIDDRWAIFIPDKK